MLTFSSADISHFSLEISNFCYICRFLKYMLYISDIQISSFLIFLTFIESLIITILIKSAKLATPGLLKISLLRHYLLK